MACDGPAVASPQPLTRAAAQSLARHPSFPCWLTRCPGAACGLCPLSRGSCWATITPRWEWALALTLLGAHVCPQHVHVHVHMGAVCAHVFTEGCALAECRGSPPPVSPRLEVLGGTQQDFLGTSWDLAGFPKLPPLSCGCWCHGWSWWVLVSVPTCGLC